MVIAAHGWPICGVGCTGVLRRYYRVGRSFSVRPIAAGVLQQKSENPNAVRACGRSPRGGLPYIRRPGHRSGHMRHESPMFPAWCSRL
jgi:hypothetical protein